MGQILGDKGEQLLPDATITNNGYGLLEGTARYINCQSTIGRPHPLDVRAKCYKYSTTRGKNGIQITTLEYVGIEGSTTRTESEWSSGTSESPIQTHRNFRNWAVNGSNGGVTKWKPWVEVDDNNNFVGFKSNAPFNIGGITSFLVPTGIVRENYYSTSPPTIKIGMIVNPSTNLFSNRVGSSCLITGCNITKIGDIYKVSVEYTNGSWNPAVYDGSVPSQTLTF